MHARACMCVCVCGGLEVSGTGERSLAFLPSCSHLSQELYGASEALEDTAYVTKGPVRSLQMLRSTLPCVCVCVCSVTQLCPTL